MYVRPVTIKICKLKKLLTKLDDMAIMAIIPICYIFSFSIIGQAMHYVDVDEKMREKNAPRTFICEKNVREEQLHGVRLATQRARNNR